jgi:hypothetical protein
MKSIRNKAASKRVIDWLNLGVNCVPNLEHDLKSVLSAESQLALKHEYLQQLIRQVLDDLPAKRDWLDPTLEKQLREEV